MKRRTRVALLCALLAPVACKKDEGTEAKSEAAKSESKDGKAADDGKAEAKAEVAAAPAKAGGGGSGESVTDALAKVPAEAVLAIHVDFKKLSASPIWGEAKKAAAMDPEAVKRMAAVAKCGLNMDSLADLAGPATMTLAVGPGEEKGVAVFNFPNAGKKEFVECFINLAKEDDPDAKIGLGERDGKTVVEIEEDAVGFLVPDDHLVAAPDSWADAVKAVLFDGAPNAGSGPLPELASKIPSGQAIWFAGDVTKMPDVPKNGPFVGLQSAVGSIDISAGLNVKADLTYADAGQATKTKGELEKGWQQVKPMASAMGVTPEIANKLTFTAADSVVTVALNLSAAEIAQVGAKMSAMMDAAAKGAPGGPPPGM